MSSASEAEAEDSGADSGSESVTGPASAQLEVLRARRRRAWGATPTASSNSTDIDGGGDTVVPALLLSLRFAPLADVGSTAATCRLLRRRAPLVARVLRITMSPRHTRPAALAAAFARFAAAQVVVLEAQAPPSRAGALLKALAPVAGASAARAVPLPALRTLDLTYTALGDPASLRWGAGAGCGAGARARAQSALRTFLTRRSVLPVGAADGAPSRAFEPQIGLQELFLGSCGLGDPGAALLRAAFEAGAGSALRTLVLDDNEFGDSAIASLFALALASAASSVPWNTFRIDCIDAETGRGVPLVQLKLPNYLRYYSDSGGVVAFDEPGLLGRAVYFVVLSDGYQVVVDPPGLARNEPGSEPGVLLNTEAGGRARVLLRRVQPAERMYRLTGAGLYRDTLLVGGAAPVAEPLLSTANVLGQDSLMAVPYRNRTLWFFGDTECAAGPRDTDCQHYGRFTTGATAALPRNTAPNSNFNPNSTPSPSTANALFPDAYALAAPPSLAYFADTNASAPGGMAADGLPDAAQIALWNPGHFPHPKAMLAGPGRPTRLFNRSTWVGSATVVRGAGNGTDTGDEHLYITYVCPTPGQPDSLFGLARWDDGAEVFRPLPSPLGYKMRYSGAQWVQRLSPEDEVLGYAYYASAFAMSRVRATPAAIEDPAQYQYFTPCAADDAGGCALNATATAQSWGWKRGNLDHAAGGHSYFGPSQEAEMVRAGLLRHADAHMQVVDAATGAPIGGVLARGSVNWNTHRQRYALIANRRDEAASGSSSRFGEIYYCEAAAVTGPWTRCAVVATHNVTGTSCYNPLQLPWLDEGGGRAIYLACTWTSMASGAPGATDRACRFDDYGGVDCAVAVPRYEYNNLVYRLDVDRVSLGS
eukprot:g1444.t1